LRLTALVEEGKLTISWQVPIEQIIDDLVQRMLTVVKRTGARRLFIDGLDGLALTAAFPMRLPAFFTALSNVLRTRGVTTFVSQETPLFTPEIEVPLAGVSAAVENIILLRYVEYEARIRRLVSILKVRESPYDSSLREFTVTSRGIEVAPTFESAEAILSGWARAHEPTPRARSASRRGRPRSGEGQ
jgi:circadian clock protein KaiC